MWCTYILQAYFAVLLFRKEEMSLVGNGLVEEIQNKSRITFIHPILWFYGRINEQKTFVLLSFNKICVFHSLIFFPTFHEREAYVMAWDQQQILIPIDWICDIFQCLKFKKLMVDLVDTKGSNHHNEICECSSHTPLGISQIYYSLETWSM